MNRIPYSDLTSSKVAATLENSVMSYARARLYLGISCVGMWATLASLALVFGLPQRLLSSSSTGTLSDVWQLAMFVFLYVALQATFDLFGGFVLPKEYGRYTPSLPIFLNYWFRAAALHGLVLGLTALVLLYADRTAGFWLTLFVYIVISLGLLGGQLSLSRLIAGIKVKHQDGVRFFLSPYSHVTGGFAGLGKRTKIVIPERWQDDLPPKAFETQVERRKIILESGSRRLGLISALAWNSLGFVLAYLAAGGVSSVATIVSFSLYNTLWAFLGVLVLPSLSRPAVFQADASVVVRGADPEDFSESLRVLDQHQDNEYSRRQSVETVFHPIPSVANRMNKLEETTSGVSAWHVARTALYLSWANLSCLSRAVHCNLGRPEVWVFLPSD
jgi:hypothetical protein